MATRYNPDIQLWNNIGATPADFYLNAGVHGLTLHATAWGTAQLVRLLVVDNAQPGTVVPINVGAAMTADGYQEFHIPSGKYRLVLTGAAGVSGAIEKVVGAN